MKNIFKDKKIDIKKTIYILMLIMVISGICGFIYETIFYRIDLGYFTKRGSTFGPWIPIYAWGGLFIVLITYRLKDKPLLVFIVNAILTGTLEYLTGFILDKYFDLRLWNYNNEILNFGNINGYICLRSVLLFGISSLLLIYVIVPYLIKLVKKYNLSILSVTLWFLLISDILTYMILK